MLCMSQEISLSRAAQFTISDHSDGKKYTYALKKRIEYFNKPK